MQSFEGELGEATGENGKEFASSNKVSIIETSNVNVIPEDSTPSDDSMPTTPHRPLSSDSGSSASRPTSSAGHSITSTLFPSQPTTASHSRVNSTNDPAYMIALINDNRRKSSHSGEISQALRERPNPEDPTTPPRKIPRPREWMSDRNELPLAERRHCTPNPMMTPPERLSPREMAATELPAKLKAREAEMRKYLTANEGVNENQPLNEEDGSSPEGGEGESVKGPNRQSDMPPTPPARKGILASIGEILNSIFWMAEPERPSIEQRIAEIKQFRNNEQKDHLALLKRNKRNRGGQEGFAPASTDRRPAGYNDELLDSEYRLVEDFAEGRTRLPCGEDCAQPSSVPLYYGLPPEHGTIPEDEVFGEYYSPSNGVNSNTDTSYIDNPHFNYRPSATFEVEQLESSTQIAEGPALTATALWENEGDNDRNNARENIRTYPRATAMPRPDSQDSRLSLQPSCVGVSYGVQIEHNKGSPEAIPATEPANSEQHILSAVDIDGGSPPMNEESPRIEDLILSEGHSQVTITVPDIDMTDADTLTEETEGADRDMAKQQMGKRRFANLAIRTETGVLNKVTVDNAGNGPDDSPSEEPLRRCMRFGEVNVGRTRRSRRAISSGPGNRGGRRCSNGGSAWQPSYMRQLQTVNKTLEHLVGFPVTARGGEISAAPGISTTVIQDPYALDGVEVSRSESDEDVPHKRRRRC